VKLPKAAPSERQIQISIKNALVMFGVVCIHIPNEGRRSAVAGRRLKQEGLLPGAPDLVCVGDAGRVAFLEVKAQKGRLSDTQTDCHDMLRRKGHAVAVVRSIDDALKALREAGWPL
jgi:hypothetical protein